VNGTSQCSVRACSAQNDSVSSPACACRDASLTRSAAKKRAGGGEAVLMQQLLEPALQPLACEQYGLGGFGGRTHIDTFLRCGLVAGERSDGEDHPRRLVARVQDVVEGLVDLLEGAGLVEHPGTT